MRSSSGNVLVALFTLIGAIIIAVVSVSARAVGGIVRAVRRLAR